MATLQAAPTRHRHTEQFSGIRTNQHLPGPDLKMQATAYTSHEVPIL